MIDAFDDLGTAQRPYIVVACIPVKGRGALVEQTIKRLYWKNGIHKVICVGDDPVDRKICEKAGALWVQHHNKPLGAKWNAAFEAAKQYDPDACLYVGSSDWLSDNWIYGMKPHIDEHSLVGVPGMYLLDIGASGLRACFWPGYDTRKRNESIGIGRMLSRSLMERLKWKPFDGQTDKSLDRSMTDRCARLGVREKMIHIPALMPLSISTHLWINKHKFDHHWNGPLTSQRIRDVHIFLSKNFPEVYEIFKTHPRPIPQ